MAEATGLWLADAEDAGASPFEFTSVVVAGSNTVTVDATALNNGAAGYKFAFDGTNTNCYGLKTLANQTTIYARAYFRIPSTMTMAQYGTCSLLQIRDDAVVLASVRARRGTAGDGVPESYQILGQDLTTDNSIGEGAWSTDTWHRVEILWLAGTGANGGATVWIDGGDAAWGEVDNDLTSYAADTIIAGNNGSAVTTACNLYMDDIKADTSAIGAYSDEGSAIAAIVATLDRKHRG